MNELISYEKKDELIFKLKGNNVGYSVCATYEKVVKHCKEGFEVSLWISDSTPYSVGYKKYICGDFIEGNYKIAKAAIKLTVNKMIQNNVFDLYIKDYNEEMECIGKMYLKKENKRLNTSVVPEQR